jgi:hypothetical protein
VKERKRTAQAIHHTMPEPEEPSELSIFSWRTTPDELKGQPQWGDHEQIMYLVDGVATL